MSRAQPIHINKGGKVSTGGHRMAVAHSCPTFGMMPPRPPRRKPIQPLVEPPSLMLPCSPMFETELTRQSSSQSRGSKEEKTELSRSLSKYSGFSCPGRSPYMPQHSSMKPKFPALIEESSETKMSSSPTVFSMLQARRSSSNVKQIFGTPHIGRSHMTVESGMGGMTSMNGMGGMNSMNGGSDDLSDMLQFDLTLDGASGSDQKGPSLPSNLT